MATDFAEERRWKITASSKVVCAVISVVLYRNNNGWISDRLKGAGFAVQNFLLQLRNNTNNSFYNNNNLIFIVFLLVHFYTNNTTQQSDVKGREERHRETDRH